MNARLAGPMDAQGKAVPILERFYCGCDFQHRVTHRRQAVAAVSRREEFGFDHAGPIGEGEKFHRFAGDLVVGALFDNESAGDNLLADVFTQF